MMKYGSKDIFVNENLDVFFELPPNVTLRRWGPEVDAELANSEIVLDESKLLIENMARNLWKNPIYPDKYEDLLAEHPKILSKYYDSNSDKIISNSDKIISKTDKVIREVGDPYGMEMDDIRACHRYHGELFKARAKTSFEMILGKYARKLELVKGIWNIINKENTRLFGDSTLQRVGIHIRRSDFRTKMTTNELVDYMMTYIEKLFQKRRYDIFLCSDDMELQNMITKKYAGNVKSYDDPGKTVNDIYGAQKALVDLYLLGTCDYILGVSGSAFTYYGWLLTKNDSYLEYFM
jgi:hypothetical protein